MIFAGRFNGQLTAMNSDTGQRLWSFQTDGGFTTTATTFGTTSSIGGSEFDAIYIYPPLLAAGCQIIGD